MENTKEEWKGIRVFFVTTMYLKEGQDKEVRTRTPGFFTKFEDAERCVKENWGDIYEIGYYNYAVIEEQEEGIYSFIEPSNIHWYKVDMIEAQGSRETYKVEKILPPGIWAKIAGFGVG